MTSKADRIRSEMNINSDQLSALNGQLQASFDTRHHRKDKIFVDCTGGDVTIRAPGTPMTNEEALRMARWIIDMLEDGP